jgi:hypothetical protein
MKKIGIVLAILVLASQAFAVSADVRIAQVYAGGGSSSATAAYKKDFVVLFNNAGTDLNIGGWVLEYGSATGNWGSSTGNYFVFPANTWIAGCSYVLVSCGTPGTGGADLPFAADYVTTSISAGAAAGRVGLFRSLNANLPCGSEIAGTLVDKVAWGTGVCAEGSAAGTTAVTTALVRGGNGALDTDNNATDFTVIATPVPFSRATPATACQPVPTETQNWGALKSTFR